MPGHEGTVSPLARMASPSPGLPWMGTSWKMTKRLSEAIEYAEALAGRAPSFASLTNSFVLPPFPFIDAVARRLVPAGLAVGAQNVHWSAQGAFTGEVSAPMLVDVGATMVAIGHAERRAMFGETDHTVAARTAGALAGGLRALVCVGEPAAERATGTHCEFVVRQLKIAVSQLPAELLPGLLVAYEPVWAIGEGSTAAAPAEANEMHGELRAALADRYGEAGRRVPVLYGGSVTVDGARDVIEQPEIDGLFVGRAAWTVDGFAAIAVIVAECG